MDRDLRLMAYLDGELDAPERAAFERELAADAGLTAELDRQKRLRERLSFAYDPVLSEPVPAGLLATASAVNDRGSGHLGVGRWAAMAASLLVGLGIGLFAMRPQGPLTEQGGVLVARGSLAQALTNQLASDAGATKVSLSFRTADGRFCRIFESAPAKLAGVACREDDHWVARALSAWAPATQTAYRTAGSQTPPAVLAAVDEMIAGQPLDAAAEARARATGWKR